MANIVGELTTVEELDRALAESTGRPLLLFKHSLTCPISARGFQQFESYLEQPDPNVIYRLIVVQNARSISNEAAARLGVKHETPQAILVRNGNPVWHASHMDITSEAIEEAIEAGRNE
jgi:bacillithiol system protein YtxJ